VGGNDEHTKTVPIDGWVKVRGIRPGREDVIWFSPGGRADRMQNQVSSSSLLGRLLIGREVGEWVDFEAAHGCVRLQIVDAGCAERSREVALQASGLA
jgi:transcription elongation GreA/GreB family factor